jgi:hypothetical protein
MCRRLRVSIRKRSRSRHYRWLDPTVFCPARAGFTKVVMQASLTVLLVKLLKYPLTPALHCVSILMVPSEAPLMVFLTTAL